MFTNGSTAMECGGGEKAAVLVEAVVAGAVNVGDGLGCLEIQNLVTTEYARANTSSAITARGAGFNHQNERMGSPLASVVPEAVLVGDGLLVDAFASGDSNRRTRSTKAGVA
jgi:hypothetical protein